MSKFNMMIASVVVLVGLAVYTSLGGPPEPTPDMYLLALDAARERLPDLADTTLVSIQRGVGGEGAVGAPALPAAALDAIGRIAGPAYEVGGMAEPLECEDHPERTGQRQCAFAGDFPARVIVSEATEDRGMLRITTLWELKTDVPGLGGVLQAPVYVWLETTGGGAEVADIVVVDF